MNEFEEKREFKEAVKAFNLGAVYKLHSKALKEILKDGYSISANNATAMRVLYMHFPEYIVIGRFRHNNFWTDPFFGKCYPERMFCCLKGFEEQAKKAIEDDRVKMMHDLIKKKAGENHKKNYKFGLYRQNNINLNM